MIEGFVIASVFFLIAMLVVPLAKKGGAGAVLGYLCSGILAGLVLRLVAQFLGMSDSKNLIYQLNHLSEFGVILMLFLVGLETQPKVLWKMKTEIFGLGTLQVGATALLILAIAVLIGLPWQTGLIVGLTFSISSTAIAMQNLHEKKWDQSVGGRKTFSALLLQDLVVIPIIAMMPLLQVHPLPEAGQLHESLDLLAGMPTWLTSLVGLLSVVVIYIFGHFGVNPLFRFIAASRLQEIFTTAALGIVTMVAAMMSIVGLSPALGVFIAGVVLSESDYRHQLEADLAPFKGLFLGLFFMTIGASFDIALFWEKALWIVLLTMALVVVKAVAAMIVARLFGIERSQRILFALALAQGGEFAFVLFSAAVAGGVLLPELADMLKIVIAMSMMVSPLLFVFYEKVIYARQPAESERPTDEIDETHPILLVGFGRFGQMVARLLASCGYRATILDFDPHHIETIKRFGWKVYYGDASRLDLLRSAGIEKARLFIIAIDDVEKTLEIVSQVRQVLPDLQMIVRARNRVHAYELMGMGVKHIFRETFDTSLRAGEQALRLLGLRSYQAHRARLKFAHGDEVNLVKLAAARGGDPNRYFDEAKASEQELIKVLQGEFSLHPPVELSPW